MALLQHAKRTAMRAAAGGVLWTLRHLPLGFRAERTLLRRSWQSGSADMLDAYLVSGYQNPRVNVQSILVRHALLARLLGPAAAAAMEEEIDWAIELNEVLRRRAAELGVKMAAYRDPVKHAAVRRVDAAIAERDHEFTDRWRQRLDRLETDPISVIEFACGSANDYRAFAAAGLGPHLDYLGIDLSEKNIANARRRHPEARWEVGDILDLSHDDRAFDYVVASDIFEHLSIEAMEHALAEAMRLAQDGVILTFFNMADAPDHEVRRVRAYHWNTLSRERIEAQLEAAGFGARLTLPIARWLRTVHGYGHSYNQHAWTIIAERVPRIIDVLPHRLEHPHGSDRGRDRGTYVRSDERGETDEH
ncbi:MAG: class I SAM-dependent methyltransferase [Chloroflexi bacterium]|nr:class I SAM-dependent methyltransferase [Chloroflexota bacterium]